MCLKSIVLTLGSPEVIPGPDYSVSSRNNNNIFFRFCTPVTCFHTPRKTCSHIPGVRAPQIEDQWSITTTGIWGVDRCPVLQCAVDRATDTVQDPSPLSLSPVFCSFSEHCHSPDVCYTTQRCMADSSVCFSWVISLNLGLYGSSGNTYAWEKLLGTVGRVSTAAYGAYDESSQTQNTDSMYKHSHFVFRGHGSVVSREGVPTFRRKCASLEIIPLD
jgi:hypothetical protein